MAQLTYGALIGGRVQMVMGMQPATPRRGAAVSGARLSAGSCASGGAGRGARTDSSNVSKLATTIAIRYGVVRRQFSQGDGPEKQILNYATHQFRLMPLLARTYAMHFGGVQTNKIYTECLEQLEVRVRVCARILCT